MSDNWHVDADPNDLGNGDLAIRDDKGTLVALIYSTGNPAKTMSRAKLIAMVNVIRGDNAMLLAANDAAAFVAAIPDIEEIRERNS